ncbi:Gfo/Idh/MocA family protein [Thalassoroseus pseudoceratinae]|uniref:Gfo/Idh/MocA family protein n=1 Tax=Thalassoroseus pseudoceratinae TaxID=2713176 RepID=UPI00141F6099|nr:Gfo/Idh/MocA family oxidoreductase [Thalassoroseus pseudoceratinae]
MTQRKLKVTINGTGFAGDYTARVYSMIPHKNGATIELAGVTSGRRENAERFAETHRVTSVYEDHDKMLATVRPDIDNVACANFAHGQYVIEAAKSGVPVIVLEKPPVVWPGYREGRSADAKTRKHESMAYLAEVLDAVRAGGSKLLYAEDFVYLDGVKGLVELMIEAQSVDKGKLLYQRGVCAHQGSHAPAYDTPAKSGGGALFNKACHPLGPCLYLKQAEGILRDGRPIRPLKVSAVALQVLKHQPESAGEHFRVMQNVDDFGRVTVVFDDQTVAEVIGHDLSISGIKNEVSVIADFGQYDMRVNPNNEHELFLPQAEAAGDLLLREKLPTPQGTSFPRPHQFDAHGYVSEMNDAVDCALEADRTPQSGPLLAWDTMAVLMAAYESSENHGAFVDVSEFTAGREFMPEELPDPRRFGAVFQRTQG